MTHEQLRAKALQKKSVKLEYENLESEFILLQQMLSARRSAGFSQADVAKKMGTKPPAITRLESALTTGKHSPKLETLQKYAKALGYRLEVRLIADSAQKV